MWTARFRKLTLADEPFPASMKQISKLSCWKRRAYSGFSRTDLMVVIGLVIVLAIIIYGSIIVIGDSSRRASCRAHLKEIQLSLQNYAQGHEDALPDCTAANPRYRLGWAWPWDLHTNLVSDLEDLGANRKHFYCPANPSMNDDFHWNFSKYDRAPTRITGYMFLLNGSMYI